MKKLVIIGVGSMAEEVLSFVNCYQLYEVVGFAVDKEYYIETFLGKPVYIIEDIDKYFDKEEIYLYISISYYNHFYKPKRLMFDRLKSMGYRFGNIISPHACIHTTDIGEGNWIDDFVYIGHNTKLGSNNSLLPCSLLAHDCVIGNHNTMSGNCSIGGNTHIGNNNYFGLGCVVFNKLDIGNKNVIGGGAVLKESIGDSMVIVSPDSFVQQSTEERNEYYISIDYKQKGHREVTK